MEHRRADLLDEALGMGGGDEWPVRGKTVIVTDRVETSGAFLLHQLLKRALLSRTDSVVVFLAFARPLSHYDRILRKLGCNLITQRDSKRFFYFDLLNSNFSDGSVDGNVERGLAAMYEKLHKLLYSLPDRARNHATIMLDDISVMEVAANGSSDHILDFLHYCHTLTADLGCSLVTLDHEDVYAGMERPTFLLQMDYLADILIKVEPLATGLADDVHGQLTVLNRGVICREGSLESKISNFHFKVKESNTEYFYPGSRT